MDYYTVENKLREAVYTHAKPFVDYLDIFQTTDIWSKKRVAVYNILNSIDHEVPTDKCGIMMAEELTVYLLNFGNPEIIKNDKQTVKEAIDEIIQLCKFERYNVSLELGQDDVLTNIGLEVKD